MKAQQTVFPAGRTVNWKEKDQLDRKRVAMVAAHGSKNTRRASDS